MTSERRDCLGLTSVKNNRKWFVTQPKENGQASEMGVLSKSDVQPK